MSYSSNSSTPAPMKIWPLIVLFFAVICVVAFMGQAASRVKANEQVRQTCPKDQIQMRLTIQKPHMAVLSCKSPAAAR